MSMNTTDFEFVRRFLVEEAGVVVDTSRAYSIESRLLPVARHEGCDSLEALVCQLRRGAEPRLVHRVVTAMTESETSFFRDIEPFNVLARTVLPRLLDARAAERTLTIWCAAASTGQEPYSIAMLLHDKFPDLATWQVRILASDVSPDALTRARSGHYSQFDVNRGLPSAYLVRYFRQEGRTWAVADSIRDMVSFHEINLHRDWPELPSCDVVLLRNVLMYFDAAARGRLLGRVHALLRSDGYLFLGDGDDVADDDAGSDGRTFERVGVGRTFMYRPNTAAA